MAKKILIIEDDPGISLGLKDEFESEGYDVWAAEDGEKGLEAAKTQKPDLIVLDIMLPVLDGYEVCKRLRMEGNRTPIIMLTVRDKEIDKILGLELGADDYVTKPFSLRELVARAKAIFRRVEARFEDLGTYSFGQINLDFKKYEATKEGKNLELTPIEFHLMKLMIQRKGEVLTRNDFLDGVWGEDNLAVSDRTVDSHIANIRKKVENDPAHPKHIISVRGVGYKFVA
jgi:two-component system alkaline phosphatase synthesis response regulator PhoP